MNVAPASTHPPTSEIPIDAILHATLLRREHSSPHSDIPPERRLMVALVRDSMRCVGKYRNARDARGKRRFEEESRWILSDDTSWIHAFIRVCETLDLDANAVRRSLGFGNRNGSACREMVAAPVC